MHQGVSLSLKELQVQSPFWKLSRGGMARPITNHRAVESTPMSLNARTGVRVPARSGMVCKVPSFMSCDASSGLMHFKSA